ncbi:MAG: hypothetical protein ACJARX_001578 [Psychroserpens sp.]
MIENNLDFQSFDEKHEESLNSKAKTMKLRDKEINLNHNREFYLNKGIDLKEGDKIFV